MNKAELQLQAKVLLVFEELNVEVKKISSKVSGLGFMLRGAHRAYIISDFQNPEKLEAAQLAWRKASFHMAILQWLIGLLDTHKGLNGYYISYNQFIIELDDEIDTALKMNEAQKADILSYWREKLPMPDDLETTVYKFMPILKSMKTGQDYFIEYQKRFEMDSDDELLDAFNSLVNNGGTGTARFSYGAALHHEFIRRGYDYSAVGDSDSLSFRDKIRLENRKIIKIKSGEINDPGL